MKDDAISRLAAIDALEKEKPTPFVNKDGSVDPFGAGRQNQWYRDGIAIMNLPSAQPEPIRLRLDHELSKEEYERLKKDCAEQPVILLPKESAQPGEDIRAMCGECDAWNQYKNYPQPGWIPWDSGELPKKSGWYIVTAYDGRTSRTTFAKYQKRLKRWDLTGARAYWRVLAWMPLPNPARIGGD